VSGCGQSGPWSNRTLPVLNNTQIIMTCPRFNKSWLYIELNKFYMRERHINSYLAAVLQVFNDSVDSARPSICYQVPLTDSIWFLTSICWHRMSNRFCHISDDNLVTFYITDSVWNLLPFCYQMLVACSAQNLSLQAWLSRYIFLNLNAELIYNFFISIKIFFFNLLIPRINIEY